MEQETPQQMEVEEPYVLLDLIWVEDNPAEPYRYEVSTRPVLYFYVGDCGDSLDPYTDREFATYGEVRQHLRALARQEGISWLGG